MLLGNPHQPWFGNGAWYQAHLTIPGVYDVAGAALHGLPFIAIGFTRDVAWTHTVSYANRFSLYELKLNPDNPLQYDYDGQWRDIGQQTGGGAGKTAGWLNGNTQLHVLHLALRPHHQSQERDPLLDGWPMFNGSVLAFRDANLNTGLRGTGQWTEKSAGHQYPGVCRGAERDWQSAIPRPGSRPRRQCLLRRGLGDSLCHTGATRPLC